MFQRSTKIADREAGGRIALYRESMCVCSAINYLNEQKLIGELLTTQSTKVEQYFQST